MQRRKMISRRNHDCAVPPDKVCCPAHVSHLLHPGHIPAAVNPDNPGRVLRSGNRPQDKQRHLSLPDLDENSLPVHSFQTKSEHEDTPLVISGVIRGRFEITLHQKNNPVFCISAHTRVLCPCPKPLFSRLLLECLLLQQIRWLYYSPVFWQSLRQFPGRIFLSARLTFQQNILSQHVAYSFSSGLCDHDQRGFRAAASITDSLQPSVDH